MRLCLPQFTVGVLGGSYYWLMHMRDLEVRVEVGAFPPAWLRYTPACAGGDTSTVLVGYVMNIVLLLLFLRFYRTTYVWPRAPAQKSKRR